jgi:hypothetical protein
MDLHYSDGIAAARTLITVEGNAAALQGHSPSAGSSSPTPAMTYEEPRCVGRTC